MAEWLDRVREQERGKGKKGGGKQQKEFHSPTEALDHGEAQRVSLSKGLRAGQYRRKTITVPPEWVPLVERLSEEFGTAGLDTWRWLVWKGLQAVEDGDRPQVKRLQGRIVIELKEE